MKLNKTIGRVATTLVATAMLASLAAPAYATGVTTPGENENSVTGITVTKNITTDGKTYAPDTTVKFSVWLGQGGTFVDGNTEEVTALPGEAGGLTEGSVTFTPSEDSLSTTYTGTATLDVHPEVFDEVGIYHYIVMEETGNYDGMQYSDAVYDVYLYVTNANAKDPEDDQLVVSYVVCNSQESEQDDTTIDVTNPDSEFDISGTSSSNKAKADLIFTNDYDSDVHDVIVTKQVAGDMGDKRNDEFELKVLVNSDDNANEKYLVEIDITGDGVVDATQTINSNQEVTLGTKIKHNGTIHIYGLSEGDTYTVTELDANQNGYVTTDTDENTAAGIVSGNATEDNASETIINTKSATAPTGIVMDIAPYALLVVIAAAGCFVFLRKRRED